MVNPIGPTPPPQPPSGPSSSGTSLKGTVDTLVAAESQQEVDSFFRFHLPMPTLLSFEKTQSDTRNASYQQLWKAQELSMATLRPFYLAAIQSAESAAAYFNSVTVIFNQMVIVADEAETRHNAIETDIDQYNSTGITQDQEAIDSLNSAMAAYGSGTYATAFSTYDSATTTFLSANSALNSASTTFHQHFNTYSLAKLAFDQAVETYNASGMTQAEFDAATETFQTATTAYDSAVTNYNAASETFTTAKNSYASEVTTYKDALLAQLETVGTLMTAINDFNDYITSTSVFQTAIFTDYNALVADLNQQISDLNEASSNLNFITLSFQTPITDFPIALNELPVDPFLSDNTFNTFNPSMLAYNSANSLTDLILTDLIPAMETRYSEAQTAFLAEQATYEAALADYLAEVITPGDYAAALFQYTTAVVTFRLEAGFFNSGVNSVDSQVASYATAVTNLRTAAGVVNTTFAGMETTISTAIPAAIRTTSIGVLPQIRDAFTISSVPNTVTPPDPAELDAIASTVDAVIASNSGDPELAQLLQAMSRYRAFLQFYLHDNFPIFAKAYLKEHPHLRTGESTPVGIGTSAGLSTITVSTSNPLLIAIIDQATSQANFSALLMQSQLDAIKSGKLATSFQLLNEGFLRQANDNAALAILGILQADPKIKPGTPAADFLQFNSLLQQINFAVASGELRNAVLSLAKQVFANVPEEALKELVDGLTAATQNFLLQNAFLLLAQLLGNPELVGQVAATLTQAPALERALLTSQQFTFRDLLSNPTSVLDLKNTLVDRLIKEGIVTDQLRAQTVISEVIRAIIKNSEITTQEQVREAIKAELLARNIDHRADLVAEVAAGFVAAELRGNYVLDAPLSRDAFSKDNLAAQLAQLNINESTAQEIANQLKDQKDPFTLRDLRHQLVSQLGAHTTLSPGDALVASTDVLLKALNIEPPTIKATTPSASELAAQLATDIQDKVKGQLSPTNSAQLATQLVSHLEAARDLWDRTIADVRSKSTAFDTALNDSLRTSTRPTWDLFKFNDDLLDPKNNVILSKFTGLMYDRAEPIGFQNAIEFLA